MTPRSRLGWREQPVEVPVAALLAALFLGGATFVGSIVVAAMTVTGALGAGTSLGVLLALLLTVLVTGVVAAGATAWLAWLAVGQFRTAAVSGWRRLLWTSYRRAREFEDGSLPGRLLRPTRLFESGGDQEGHLVEELKSRYVAGEIDEIDFERELGRLLGGGAEDGQHVRRRIEVTAADGGSEQGDDVSTGTRSGAGSSRSVGTGPDGDPDDHADHGSDDPEDHGTDDVGRRRERNRERE